MRLRWKNRQFSRFSSLNKLKATTSKKRMKTTSKLKPVFVIDHAFSNVEQMVIMLLTLPGEFQMKSGWMKATFNSYYGVNMAFMRSNNCLTCLDSFACFFDENVMHAFVTVTHNWGQKTLTVIGSLVLLASSRHFLQL